MKLRTETKHNKPPQQNEPQRTLTTNQTEPNFFTTKRTTVNLHNQTNHNKAVHLQVRHTEGTKKEADTHNNMIYNTMTKSLILSESIWLNKELHNHVQVYRSKRLFVPSALPLRITGRILWFLKL